MDEIAHSQPAASTNLKSEDRPTMLTSIVLAVLTIPLGLVAAAPASHGQLGKRTPRQAFIGCSPGTQGGDTLVTPPSPDGCAVSSSAS